MICKNCGANIKNRETYCPSCGMELMVPYSKSLKEKYIAGEYQDNPNNSFIHNKKDQPVQKEEYQRVKHDNEYEQYHGNETHEEYQPEGSGSSAFWAIILFLVVALLFGFVIGIILFSGALHHIPIFSNIKV
jgi:hypothetical protein